MILTVYNTIPAATASQIVAMIFVGSFVLIIFQLVGSRTTLMFTGEGFSIIVDLNKNNTD
jgi:hypothetical protein